MALSFDGLASGYEYGVDFGLLTKDYSNVKVDMGSGTGVDAAGFYSVSNWNDNIAYSQSSPFAINDGVLSANLLENNAGAEGSSFYRTVSFQLDQSLFDAGLPFQFDAHWTMSCGNDVLEGGAELVVQVDEPSPLVLAFLGLLLISVSMLRKKNNV